MGSSPQVFPSTQIDTIDSHYQYVKQRILALNQNRVFGGIVEARDWPYKEASDQAFYLAIDRAAPSRNVASWHSPLYTFEIQWVWIILGTDLSPTVQAANRGDRYRISFAMQEEILQGLWPGFCEKQKWAAGSGDVASVSGTPYVPSEKVWWRRPTFSEKIDRNTGILFGYGAIQLSAFAPAMSS